jgi:nucleoside-diphosphate-sugar epimerase
MNGQGSYDGFVSDAKELILVTGASGFLGAEVVRLLVEGGWPVRVLMRRERGNLPGVEVAVGDVGDVLSLTNACAGVGVVVHAAGLAHVFGAEGKRRELFDQVNEQGTVNVVRAARDAGVRVCVVASSVSVYGEYEGDVCDESTVCRPVGPYAVSKYNAELRMREIAERSGMNVAMLRFATIYGEGDRGNVAKLIALIGKGRFVRPGSGANRKSLIHKQDAAKAVIAVVERGFVGVDVFNVSARPATVRGIVAAISKARGKREPRLFVPEGILRVVVRVLLALGDPGRVGERVLKLLKDDVYSGEKFEKMFRFSATVGLDEGMQREVSAMQVRG